METQKELELLLARAAQCVQRGFVGGTSGNVSLRLGDRIFISPTGERLAGLTFVLTGELSACSRKEAGRMANKVINTILNLRDNMSGGLIKAARNTKGVSKEMVSATRSVVQFKRNHSSFQVF